MTELTPATQTIPTLGYGFSSSEALFKNLTMNKGQLYSLPSLQSAREEGRKSRKDIVKAARHVERYSEHIRGGIDKKADYVVGHNIMVQPRPDWASLGIEDKDQREEIIRQMKREWRSWAYDRRLLQDAEGHYDFGGMMWLAFRNVTAADGECAGVIHYDEKRAAKYGWKWATYVSIVDPDRVETPPEHAINPNIKEGKVLDKDGRWIAMFVRKYHPNDATVDANDWALVPRENKQGRACAFHWFVKTRASQIRGISSLVTVLRQSGMLDQFDDAYLGAAIINQVLATWVETPVPETAAENLAPSAWAEQTWAMFGNKMDYYDKAKMRIGSARVPVLPPGDKINMEAVSRGIDDPTYFRNAFLKQFASSIGIAFEELAMSFGDANFSAARAAILSAWVGIMKLRYQFCSHVAALIYDAVIEEAWVKGRIKVPAGAPEFNEARQAWTSCGFTGPGMPQLDPEKEAKGNQMDLANRTTSRTRIAAGKGEDIIDVYDEIAWEMGEAEERGIELEVLMPGQQTQDATIDPDGGGGKKKKTTKKSGGTKDADGDGKVNEKEAA